MTAAHAHLTPVGDPLIASRQDGSHPRPQALRAAWTELSGEWGFAFDDRERGLREHWEAWGADHERSFPLRIQVPFPFESTLSGIGDTSYHPVVWYERELTAEDFAAAGFAAAGFAGAGEQRLMIRFGAVDYRCRVWLEGHLLGEHEGGHTPFSFDATDALDPARSTHRLVVRAEDDPLDVAQPRGKQEWRREPHAIWYHRTSGIWQPVWLEAVDELHIVGLHWTPDVPRGEVRLELELSRRPEPGAETAVDVQLTVDEEALARVTVSLIDQRAEVVLPLPAQRNGQAHEELLWRPGSPRLIDATVTLKTGVERRDVVASYFGMRSASIGGGAFLLNQRPVYLRSVLYQGYWTESHLAAPSTAALREDAELILALGFNAVRVHQKVEDPRFLHWADRLGLLVWGEAPSAYEFGTRAIQRTTEEWLATLERDRSHPSIVTWVPLNESWGVQQIAHSEPQRQFSRALAALTRAVDPTRPVVSNDGWEHADSDLLTVHDYEADPAVVTDRYRDAAGRDALFAGPGPAGRTVLLQGQEIGERPYLLSEFGGISFTTTYTAEDAWGYSAATSPDDFVDRVAGLVGAVRASEVLAGFCYTQFADTLQETNGLVSDDRTPKAPLERLRQAILTGEPRP